MEEDIKPKTVLTYNGSLSLDMIEEWQNRLLNRTEKKLSIIKDDEDPINNIKQVLSSKEYLTYTKQLEKESEKNMVNRLENDIHTGSTTLAEREERLAKMLDEIELFVSGELYMHDHRNNDFQDGYRECLYDIIFQRHKELIGFIYNKVFLSSSTWL